MVVIGGFLLLAAVLIAPSVYTAWRDWRSATAVSAATGRPGQSVVAAGHATTGARGILTAPLSGQPCVWYQQEVRRHIHRQARSGVERDVRVESITTSERPFGVTDDEGRVVTVRPDGLRQIDLRWAHREERAAEPHEQAQGEPAAPQSFGRRVLRFDVAGFETLEWIVAPGQDVVIGGVLGPDGQVVAPARGPYVVRASTLREVRRRRARVLGMTAGATLLAAVLGLALTVAGS